MFWFNQEKKQRMNFLQTFVPSSKAQLLQVAMWFHKGDTQKAQAMVDFYTNNMPALPDFDPVPTSFMEEVKDGATGLFTWLKANQDDLIQGYQFLYSLFKNKGALPSTPAETPLPPINE